MASFILRINHYLPEALCSDGILDLQGPRHSQLLSTEIHTQFSFVNICYVNRKHHQHITTLHLCPWMMDRSFVTLQIYQHGLKVGLLNKEASWWDLPASTYTQIYKTKPLFIYQRTFNTAKGTFFSTAMRRHLGIFQKKAVILITTNSQGPSSLEDRNLLLWWERGKQCSPYTWYHT